MEETSQQRLRIAQRIHDLLLHELGESVDVSLLLGPPEYARAVLSLCRSCGSTELVRLAEEFVQATDAVARLQRQARVDRPRPDWRLPAAGELPGAHPPSSTPAT
ncbi:MAG TPA: hypothetical protein PLW24_21465 [Burkholderiaceae bacterium]|nr:hypothetical protein [Burkholderiaceae bacterium]HNB46052.1 hypothetical protein [Burkholderiaceae bacterium]HNG82053.1 hypothetical protein [Burkholderiaceae bacterium]